MALMSGDESFDYIMEKPVNTIKAGVLTLRSAEASECDSLKAIDSGESIKEKETTGVLNVSSSDSVISCLEKERDCGLLKAKDSSCLFNVKLTHLKEKLEKEANVGGWDLSSTESVISCLEKEEYGVLQGAGEGNAETIKVKDVIGILEIARDDGIKFHSLAEMLNHVSLQLPGEFVY